MTTPPTPATVERAVDVFLHRFLRTEPADASRTRLLVAFSGGPDSLALLAALARHPEVAGGELHAAHLDHGLDDASTERAQRAVRSARRLGLGSGDVHVERVVPPPSPEGGIEAWARDRRYAFLRRVADEIDAAAILTAHHADDQAETVLLRLLHGSGLEGLAGIRRRSGRIHRPLLDVSRRQIEAYLERLRHDDPELRPADDPTNRDPVQPRARVRHHLLPRLRREMGDVGTALRSLGRGSSRLRRRLEDLFLRRLSPRELRWGGVGIDAGAFLDLPPVLRHHALSWLHRRAGIAYPASAAAGDELERQIDAGGDVAVDCGDGWSWRIHRGLFRLQPSANPAPPFTYTRHGPGTLAVPELDLSIRFAPAAVEPWMFRGERWRAGLRLPHTARPSITVRTRRAGDRLHPLGSEGRRSVKDLLIDRHVPRHVRDRLPLLFVDGILAWVPGVTVDERFRLVADEPAWLAEIRRPPVDPLHTSPTRTRKR